MQRMEIDFGRGDEDDDRPLFGGRGDGSSKGGGKRGSQCTLKRLAIGAFLGVLVCASVWYGVSYMMSGKPDVPGP
jgi:hypothetical protein